MPIDLVAHGSVDLSEYDGPVLDGYIDGDAISIALRLSAQIYVTEEVIKEAGIDKNEIVSDNKQTIIPKYSLEDLEVKLKQAVDEEEYEKAAKIRDKIKELESWSN